MLVTERSASLINYFSFSATLIIKLAEIIELKFNTSSITVTYSMTNYIPFLLTVERTPRFF